MNILRSIVVKCVTALCLISFGVAEALPPVILTNDQSTKLDLTSDEAKLVDLLDCQLHVSGQSPNFRLVHSKGDLPIPLLAIKTMQDGSSVDIAVKGALAGLPVSRMRLNYKNVSEKSFTQVELTHNVNNGFSFPQNSNYFLIQKTETEVAGVLKSKFGEKNVRSFDDRVIVLHVTPNIESVGGYGFYPWFKIPQTVQVEYECIF
jgi:hypothetical protein